MTRHALAVWIRKGFRWSVKTLVGSCLFIGCERSTLPTPPFRIEATVVEAIQDGPIVLDITLSYNGTNEFKYCSLSFPQVTVPKTWIKCNKYKDGDLKGGDLIIKLRLGGSDIECYHLHPGDRKLQRVYLHHDRGYKIDSGKAWLDICCWVEQSKPGLEERFGLLDGMDRIANPSVALELDVIPANLDNLASLRHRLERLLATNPSKSVSEDVANYLYYTRHRPLAPIAWSVIEGPYCDAVDYLRLFQAVDESTSDWGEVEARFIRLAHNSTYGARRLVFNYLAERKPAISSKAFATLSNSESIWVRVLTYLWFSKRCDSLWVTDFLASLPELTQILPQPELTRLLRDLDDDVFRVREQATVRLMALGERVETQLKEASHHLPSLEAKQRLRLILERIAAAKEAPEWKPILEHLSSGDCDKDAALAVLRAIAQGRPDAELTKAAIASLNKLSPAKQGGSDGQGGPR